MGKDGFKRIWRGAKSWIIPPLHKPERREPYDVLGSDYGGWPVIKGSLGPDSCVFSFGVGEDVSFDLALIEKCGCRVFAFDPTPRCLDWLAGQELPELFVFHPVGLSDSTKTLRFYAPDNDKFVSYTQSEARSVNEMVELPVRSLREIANDLEARNLDFVKMDVEGSEYDAIPEMLRSGPLPRQLCIEFHHNMFGYTGEDTRAAVSLLREAGYELYYVSSTGHEYGFVLSP